MAITYITSTERPDDGQTFGGNTACSLLLNAVGAATGDLVVVVAQYRGATTIEVSETGGQTWNILSPQIDAANLCQVQYFWCRWSDENANGNNPGFFANGISGNPFTCVGHIFRPTSSTNLWAIDAALTSTQFTAPTTPFTVTRNGVTPTNANTATIASWHTADANTWNTLTGTGWTSMGVAQYRNLTGGTQSSTYAYKIQTSSGATGSVSKNQATNGGDAGVSAIVSFYEFSAGYTMAAAAGSFSITGNTVGVSVGRKVTAIVGSCTFTGNSTGLKAIRSMTAGTGAYSFAGNNVSLKSAKSLSAGASAYMITGAAITFSIPRKLTAISAAFILTGRPAVLTNSATNTVIKNVGLKSRINNQVSGKSIIKMNITQKSTI